MDYLINKDSLEAGMEVRIKPYDELLKVFKSSKGTSSYYEHADWIRNTATQIAGMRVTILQYHADKKFIKFMLNHMIYILDRNVIDWDELAKERREATLSQPEHEPLETTTKKVTEGIRISDYTQQILDTITAGNANDNYREVTKILTELLGAGIEQGSKIEHQPFTSDELEVNEAILKVHSSFMALSRTHVSELPDWTNAIHRLQTIMAMRVMRRKYPNYYSTSDDRNKDDSEIERPNKYGI